MKPYGIDKHEVGRTYRRGYLGTHREDRRVGGYKHVSKRARQEAEREIRDAVRYEPKPRPIFYIKVGPSFTCPRGCACVPGRCPAFMKG